MATIQTCIKPVLSKLSNEELGLIRIILEYGKKSEDKLGKDLTDPEVLKEWSMKGTKKAIPGELALHFQEGFGIVDAFKGIDSDYGKQLDYVIRKMLVKSLKTTKPVFATAADTKKGALEREKWITTKFMESMWDKLPEEAKKEIATSIEHILKDKGIAGDKAARAAAGLLAGGLAGARAILGFQFHILLAQFANIIVKTIAGRGLAFAGNAALQRIAGFLLGGPYAWIIAGLLLLPTVTGLLMPRALDKYLPVVFVIGLKRISINEEKIETSS